MLCSVKIFVCCLFLISFSLGLISFKKNKYSFPNYNVLSMNFGYISRGNIDVLSLCWENTLDIYIYFIFWWYWLVHQEQYYQNKVLWNRTENINMAHFWLFCFLFYHILPYLRLKKQRKIFRSKRLRLFQMPLIILLIKQISWNKIPKSFNIIWLLLNLYFWILPGGLIRNSHHFQTV